jgi:hypothetical protein
VTKCDLGETPWDIDLDRDGFVKPTLKLNYRIPDAINQLKHNPIFQALILPAVLREVFMFIFWDCDGTTDEDSWQNDWMEMGHRISGESPPETEEPAAVRNWVDDVLREFSLQHGLSDRLVIEMGGAET